MTLFTSPIGITLLFLVGLVLVFISAGMRRGGPGSDLTTLGRFFLVLLRVVLGWHLLVEGLEKLHNPEWSSESFLRESTGPLASRFRALAGDRLIDQFTPGEGNTLSPALKAEWDRYFDAFLAHYEVSGEQKETAQRVYDQARSQTETWLRTPQPIEKPSPYPPPLTEEMDAAKRSEAYSSILARVDAAEAELSSGSPKAAKDWREAKAEAAKFRSEMKKDLDGQTATFKKALQDTLKADQKARPAMPDRLPRPIDWSKDLDRADAIMTYGLIACGVGLIVGLFSRVSALGGGVLLLLINLSRFPYLNDFPPKDGMYLKNVVEMLALFSLAGIPTGKWAGVDALLQFVNPFNWRRTPRPANVNTATERRLENVAKT